MERDLPSDVKKWCQATGKPLQIPVTEGTVGHINAATSPSEYFLQRKRQLILNTAEYNFVQSYLFLYLAMMKHLYYILMFTFLCLGLTAISQEEQPDSRNTTGSPAGIVVGSPASECSFTAYTQCALYTATHRSLFNDENTDCWTNEALCPNSLYTHNHASPKFLKMRILKPAGQLEHLLSSHLSAGERQLHSIPVLSAIPADTISMHCCIS